MRDNKEWGWDMAAIDALRDAILCAENDNIGGAWSYIREADSYLYAMKAGETFAPAGIPYAPAA